MISAQKDLDIVILIPCYNNLSGLIKSLESIKYYSGRFVILIIDDGSELRLCGDELLLNIGEGVPLQIIRNETNEGITFSLNKGLTWIRSNLKVKYIARLDCGDICHPDRFYKQFEFLQSNLEVGLLGSWCKFQSHVSSINYTYTTPLDHQDIIKEMHLRNVFIHPTVMIRTKILDKVGHYPNNYEYVEDYAFFWNILRVTKVAILKDFLVTCEINNSGISISKRRKQILARLNLVNHFYSNSLLRFINMLRLYCLLMIPYHLILKIKYYKSNRG